MLKKTITLIIMILSIIPIVNATITCTDKIYISSGWTNIDTINATCNTTYLEETSEKTWLLKKPIIIESTGRLYINSSDCQWLRMENVIDTNINNMTYIDNYGRIFISDTKITSWNTTSNSVVPADKTDKYINRSYIYSHGIGGNKITNSNISYLGGNSSGNAYGLIFRDANGGSIVENSTLSYNHIGLLVDENNTIVRNTQILNSTSYGLQIVHIIFPLSNITIEQVTALYSGGCNFMVRPVRPEGTLLNSRFSYCTGAYSPGNQFNFCYMRDTIVEHSIAHHSDRSDWHSCFDFKTYNHNITVDNCTAYVCQNAFYVHNYDTDVTIRNSVAHDADNGFSIGSGSQNNSVINCTAYNMIGGGFGTHSSSENQFINNTAYNCSYGGLLQPYNWTAAIGTMEWANAFLCYNNTFRNCNFSGNTHNYEIQSSSQDGITFIDKNYIYNPVEAQLIFYVSENMTLQYKHDNGKAFKVNGEWIPSYPDGSYYEWMPSDQTQIESYEIYTTPTTSHVNISINNINESIINFTAESTDGNKVNFTVCNLTGTTQYTIKKDSIDFATKTSNNAGCIMFNNSAWTEHEFIIEEATTESTSSLNITSWYTNATNASTPQDIMFLTSINNSIYFNITIENESEVKFDWQVNKISQNNNKPEFIFNIPNCNAEINPSDCIWEIHLTINDTQNETHHEWLISNLSIENAPDFIDYFTDKKSTYRDLDPWNRILPSWNKTYSTLPTDNAYAQNYAKARAEFNITEGTWEFRYQHIADGGSIDIGFIGGYGTYTKPSDAHHHVTIIPENTGGAPFSIDYDGSGIAEDGNWHTVRIVRTHDGWIYIWKDDYFDMYVYDPSMIVTNYIEISLIYTTNIVNADSFTVWKNRDYFPTKNISYTDYVWNHHEDTTFNSGLYIPDFKKGIVIKGKNNTLLDVYLNIGNTSRFNYNPTTRTAIINTNLIVDEGSTLDIDNETIYLNSTSGNQLELVLNYGSTLNLTNSKITSLNENYWIWNNAGSTTHYGNEVHTANYNYGRFGDKEYMKSPDHSSYCNFYSTNSIINNSAHMFFDSPYGILIENTIISNLHETDIGNYSVSGDYAIRMETGRKIAQGNKSFWIYTDEMAIHKLKIDNVTFTSSNTPTNLTFMINAYKDRINIKNLNLESENILIKPSYTQVIGQSHTCQIEQAPYKWMDDSTPSPVYSGIGLINTKFNNLYLYEETGYDYNNNSVGEFASVKYYLDLSVKDSNGTPIANATIHIRNEIDNTNHPPENLIDITEYTGYTEDYCYYSIYKKLQNQPISLTTTTETGHTPKPHDENNTIILTDYNINKNNNEDSISLSWTKTHSNYWSICVEIEDEYYGELKKECYKISSTLIPNNSTQKAELIYDSEEKTINVNIRDNEDNTIWDTGNIRIDTNITPYQFNEIWYEISRALSVDQKNISWSETNENIEIYTEVYRGYLNATFDNMNIRINGTDHTYEYTDNPLIETWGPERDGKKYHPIEDTEGNSFNWTFYLHFNNSCCDGPWLKISLKDNTTISNGKPSTKTINYTYEAKIYDQNNIWTSITQTIYPNSTIQQLTPIAQITGIDPNETWYRSDPNTPTITIELEIPVNHTKANISIETEIEMNITVNTWQPESSGIKVNFTAETTNGNNINFTVCNLSQPTQYTIKKDSANFATKTSNSAGCITFNNSAWTEHEFTIEEYTTESTSNSYYLSTRGSDANIGTSISDAWGNLSYACNQLEAGDTLYIIDDGIYYNHTCTLANSGNTTHPITITAYNGTARFVGDNISNLIHLENKQNIKIDSLFISNYSRAVSVKHNMTSLTINNITIMNTSSNAIEFYELTTPNGIVTDIIINNITIRNVHDGGIKGYDYVNITGITISNITINKTGNVGIRFQRTSSMLIENAKIYNTGSDAIQLQDRTRDSILRNIIINNTGWHGIGLQESDDHIDGNQVDNITIQNVEISWVTHNGIDFQTGAYNSIVDGFIIHDEKASSNGIQTHISCINNTIKNGIIYNVTRGIVLYQPNNYVENVTISDTIIQPIHMEANNTEFMNIRLSDNNTYSITGYSTANNITIRNTTIGEDKYLYIRGIDWRIIDILDNQIKYDDNNIESTFISTEGRIYTGSTTLELTYYTNGSQYTGNMPSTIYRKNITLRPTYDYLYNVTILSNTLLTLSSSEPENPTLFQLETLNPSTTYAIKKDTETISTNTTDESGILIYFYNQSGDDWTTAHTFEFTTQEAPQNNYYLSTHGSDTNAGTSISQSWGNLSYACNQLDAGDTLYIIDDGIYYNHTCTLANSGNETHRITITAYNSTPRIDGTVKDKSTTYKGINLMYKNQITITNLNITRYYNAISHPGSNILVSNCILGDTGEIVALISEANSENNTIQNSVLYNAGWNTIEVGANITAGSTPSRNITVYNNTIYNSHIHCAIDLYGNLEHVTIDSNLLYNNTAGNVYTHEGTNYQTYLEIRNNIIRDANVDGLYLKNYNNHSIVYNNTFSNIFSWSGIEYNHADNVTITENRFINVSNPITLNGENRNFILERNHIYNQSKYYQVSYNNTNITIRNPQETVKINLYHKNSPPVILEFTNNRLFEIAPYGEYTTFISPRYYPDRSNCSIAQISTQNNGGIGPGTIYEMQARPTNDYINITINTINQTEDTWNITITSSESENPTLFTLETLNPSTTYAIKKDSTTIATNTTDNNGILTYFYNATDNDWTTSHIFEFIAQTSTDPSTFYIRPDGNDTCSGQINQSYAENQTDCAWQTIQHAANTLTAGKTARIQQGTYNEQSITFNNSGNETHRITIIGDNMPTISGYDTIITISKAYLHLNGLNITSTTTKAWNTNNYSNTATLIITSTNSTRIENNTIYQYGFGGYSATNPEQGGYTRGIYVGSCNSITITNNTIHTENINSPGIYLSSSSRCNLTENRIDARHSDSIYISDSSTESYYNHTITSNTGYQDKQIYYYYRPANQTISNIDIGGLIIAYGNNISLHNITSVNSEGIRLINTHNSIIHNYTLLRTNTGSEGILYTMVKSTYQYPLYLYRSTHNNITQMNVSLGGRHNYGIYFYLAHYNRIDNFNFKSRYMMSGDGHNDAFEVGLGQNSGGQSDYNEIYNFYIDSRTWSDYPLYIHNGVDNMTFENGIVLAPSGAYQIITLDDVTNTIIRNITITHAPPDTGASTIWIRHYNSNNMIIDSVINRTNSGYVISAESLSEGTVYLKNTILKTRISVTGLDTLFRQWYLDIYLHDTHDNPLPGANITCQSNSNIPIFSILTDEEGRIDTQTLIEYTKNSTVTDYDDYSNYTLTITKYGYETQEIQLNMTESKSLNLSMTLEIDSSMRWVRPDGNDTCSGLLNTSYTEDQTDCAWQTIQHAADTLTPGKTARVQQGTYTEHITLQNSGNQTHKISYIFDNNPILDGLDKTGTAIDLNNKSYINLTGFHIKNYGTAISGNYDTLINITMQAFTIENVNSSALRFDSARTINLSISNFTIYGTGKDLSPAVYHFSYSGSGCEDIEIHDFTIRDTYSEAIQWRDCNRVHIHDGRVYNITYGDGVHLQLNVNNSVIENIWVNNTQWHGIAIHDHTAGSYPLYNNTIRNCFIGYGGHNDIDLHSGAYNTLVENNIITGTPATGQGIYFHNLGRGLVARNNTVINMYRGIYCEPYGTEYGPGFYIADILIENNTIIGTTSYNGFYTETGILENITFRNNRIINSSVTSYEILVYKSQNVIVKNNEFINSPISNKYEIRYIDNITIEDTVDDTTRIRLVNTVAEIRQTDNSIFQTDSRQPTHNTDYSTITEGGAATSYYTNILKYKMKAIPYINHLNITINTISQINDIWNITAISNESENPTTFTLETLYPNTIYTIKRNSITIATNTTDDNGILTYFYNNTGDDWTTAHTFEFIRTISTTLNTPNEGHTTKNSTIRFNCSSTTENTLTNITLWGNWTEAGEWHANETRTVTGQTNETIFQKTILEGTYIWNCQAFDNETNHAFASENRTIKIDQTEPNITITSPENNTQIAYATQATITITTNENAICHYNTTSINFTYSKSSAMTTTGTTTHTLSVPVSASSTHTYYYKCNDTAGNINENATTHTFSVASAPTTTPSSGGGSSSSSSSSGGASIPIIPTQNETNETETQNPITGNIINTNTTKDDNTTDTNQTPENQDYIEDKTKTEEPEEQQSNITKYIIIILIILAPALIIAKIKKYKTIDQMKSTAEKNTAEEPNPLAKLNEIETYLSQISPIISARITENTLDPQFWTRLETIQQQIAIAKKEIEDNNPESEKMVREITAQLIQLKNDIES